MRIKEIIPADAKETPNRLLNRWRGVFTQKGVLDLDQLAEIAQLSDEQITHLYDNTGLLGLAADNQMGIPTPVAGSPVFPALRLYGLLAPSQQDQIFRNGLAIESLTPEQFNALREIVTTCSKHQLRITDPEKNSQFLVGIYDRNGQRVDKLGPGLSNWSSTSTDPSDLLSVSMRAEPLRDEERYPMDGAPKATRVTIHNAGYTMVLKYKDGGTAELPILISIPGTSVKSATPSK
jgi:hypothetical protein